MSRHWDDADTQHTRIWRAVAVAEYHDNVSVMEYLRATRD